MRWREVEPHCVHLQCTCQMLCSFIVNAVMEKIQQGECLCEMKTGDLWFHRGRVVFYASYENTVRGAFSE